MESIGLNGMMTASVENFTSDNGIKFRRLINKPLKGVLILATTRKVIVEAYAKLEKNVPYIFASTHPLDEDVICGLSHFLDNSLSLHFE